jgi:hypothetical protein
MTRLKRAKEDEDPETYEDTLEELYNDPLSLEVRSGWERPGDPLTPLEYRILLCTGGPAVRILGTLNEYGEPIAASLQHQDWHEPWKHLYIESESAREALLEYAQRFYFPQ